MSTFFHPTAEVSSEADIGENTKVWNWVQIREGARIGRGCILSKGVYIDAGVVIGDYCKIQNGVSVYQGVTLGSNVFVGPNATFTNDLYPRANNPDWEISPTRVLDGASIGANATVICGVTIGRFALVAAGALISKSTADRSLMVGVPARLIDYVCDLGHRLLVGEKLPQRATCPTCGQLVDFTGERDGTDDQAF